MMKSTAFHTKRHRRYSKKLMKIHAGLTNPNLNLETTPKTWLLLAKDGSDAIAYARQCHTYQIHDDIIHLVPRHLHPMSSS